MQFTYESLNILLLLIPGLISSRILSAICRDRRLHISEQLLESLIFAFIIYLFVELIHQWEPLALAAEKDGVLVYQLAADRGTLLWTGLLTIIIPILWGFIVHNDYHMVALRRIKVTSRTSRETAWEDVFTNQVRFLTIHLRDGRRLSGWPLYYSYDNKEGFVYLSKSAWIVDTDYKDTASHGILVHSDEIKLIEFMWNPDEEGVEHG